MLVPIDTEKSMEAKVGDKVTIRLSNSLDTESEIVYIKEENEKRVIVFKITEHIKAILNSLFLFFSLLFEQVILNLLLL